MSQKSQAEKERFKKEAIEYFRSFEFDPGGFEADGATDRLLTKLEQGREFARSFPLVPRALGDMERYGTTLLACEWAFDSVYEGRPGARVMFLAIAFEVLLEKEKEETRPHLAKKLADLLCASNAAARADGLTRTRARVRQVFEAFYELRNDVAHGKFRGLSIQQASTAYFESIVLKRRPYLRREWCVYVIENAVRDESQGPDRHRFWAPVPELGGRYLRVITLADKVTIHNAFPDRGFRS